MLLYVVLYFAVIVIPGVSYFEVEISPAEPTGDNYFLRFWLLMMIIIYFEELVFRFLPLVFIEMFEPPLGYVLLVGILSSVTFGYIHDFSTSSIAIQGVLGAFIFVAGYKAMIRADAFRALTVCYIIHACYNTSILATANFL